MKAAAFPLMTACAAAWAMSVALTGRGHLSAAPVAVGAGVIYYAMLVAMFRRREPEPMPPREPIPEDEVVVPPDIPADEVADYRREMARRGLRSREDMMQVLRRRRF